MFKVGDEVEKYRNIPGVPDERDTTGDPPIGHKGRITGIGVTDDGIVVIELDSWPRCPFTAMIADEYRKVERKTDRMNLTEWLSRPSDYEEPKRQAKTKERS